MYMPLAWQPDTLINKMLSPGVNGLCEHEDTLYTTVAYRRGIGWPLCGFRLCGFLKDFLQIETSGYACHSSQAAGSEDKSETGLLL